MILHSIAERAVFREGRMGKADLLSAGQVFSGLNCFRPGQRHTLHSHAGQDKLYFVLEGSGEVTVGEETSTVTAGDLVLAAEDVPHGIRNPGPADLVVLTVMAPPPRPKHRK